MNNSSSNEVNDFPNNKIIKKIAFEYLTKLIFSKLTMQNK